MHIGLIGGIGPASTLVYYDAIVRAHASFGQRLELTIVHADVREMIANLEAGKAEHQAEIFANHIDRLRAAGCTVAALTSMGGHFCVEELKAISSLPIVNAVPAIGNYLAGLGVERVGVLGTRRVMETRLYGVDSVEVIIPTGSEIDDVHNAYVGLAESGTADPSTCDFFIEAGAKLYREGAEIIVLGGTDLSIAFAGRNPGYPLADTALIHAAAISAASMERDPPA